MFIKACSTDRMSRGHSQPRSYSRRRVLGKCKSKCNIENAVIIDVDMVNLDIPESSYQGSKGARETRRNMCSSGPILIDDEDGDTDDTPRNANGDATNKIDPSSSNSPLAEEMDSDECHMSVRKGNFPSKSAARNCFGLGFASDTSISKSGTYSSSESGSSESDSSDCEIMEGSSGNIREHWEKAAFRKKTLMRDQFGSEDRVSASGLSTDPEFSSSEKIHDQVNMENFINMTDLNHSEEMRAEAGPSNSSNGKENHSSSVATTDEHTESPLDSDPNIGIFGEGPGCQNKEPISEKCLHRPQSTDETLFDQTRAVSREMQVPLPGLSLCNSRMHQDVHDGVRFVDKDEQVPLETSFCTAEVHIETRFQEKEGPYPVKLSQFSSQPCNGREIFPDSVSILDKEEQVCGGPPCGIQSRYNAVVDQDIFGFQGKKKSAFEPSLFNSQLLDGQQSNCGSYCCSDEQAALGEPFCQHHAGSETPERSPSHIESYDVPQLQKDLIGERERHKESEEYKRAVEEEWASRQRQLQIQAEEAQRLRKRIRHERRLLDMEKRQKQRLEEIRESQRKDEETISLKEKLRTEVQNELNKMELRYRDMASLLRGLGIHVEGGLYPMSREVNAAYKQALLRFHPDRSSRSDIRQQVEAEEKFKLISRLKEKLLPVT